MMSESDDRIGVLFVCLGNICRSPLAEAIFLHKINERGLAARFRVDSAGTGGWHAGEAADQRAQQIAKKNKIKLISQAREVSTRDFQNFHYIVCMDQENHDEVVRRGAPRDRVFMMLEFDTANHLVEVPDPYYGAADSFQTVFNLLNSACDALIDHVIEKHGA